MYSLFTRRSITNEKNNDYNELVTLAGWLAGLCERSQKESPETQLYLWFEMVADTSTKHAFQINL